jgi:pimeloyl-ACP methyl ester carboxylesterase
VTVRQGWQQIELNDVPQWVSVRGDAAGPVLLFLHGGPGGAEFGPRRKYLADLERSWLVVEWEQRGAGRSFRGDESPETLSLEILVRDAVVLVERISERVDRPVVVVGHSFGTALGVLVAQRIPDRLAGYVGASQVVCWAEQEARSYDWVLGEARRRDDAKAVAALSAIGRPVAGVYSSGRAAVETQRRWLGAYGGVSADPGFLNRWVVSMVTARDYPLRAKLRFRAGMARSMDLVWPELGREIDFARDVTGLSVPVHLFAGRIDRITDLDQIQTWYDRLEAPAKHLEIVDGVGHLNLYEAPQRFVALLDTVRESLPG